MSPKGPLSEEATQNLIERAMISGGVRFALPPGIRRREVKLDLGFSKFFQTKAESKMKSLHVKMLMGHDVGLAESYYKPTEEELLQEYLEAAGDLAIEKPMEITEQTQELATQMESKDKQIQALNEGLSEMKVQMECEKACCILSAYK
jgi:hypothetical protein